MKTINNNLKLDDDKKVIFYSDKKVSSTSKKAMVEVLNHVFDFYKNHRKVKYYLESNPLFLFDSDIYPVQKIVSNLMTVKNRSWYAIRSAAWELQRNLKPDFLNLLVQDNKTLRIVLHELDTSLKALEIIIEWTKINEKKSNLKEEISGAVNLLEQNGWTLTKNKRGV